MPAEDALLFIDANKYLDLYRTDTGKKLLAPLGEQVEHIFITQQFVGEVQRNKIQVAAEFLRQKSKGLKLQTFNVPDHLSGTITGQAKDILELMNDIGRRVKSANEEVDALALGIMEQISCSEDEVSLALGPIFSKAVAHSPEELQRARNRRELGNPPGKNSNPIGDQLTWEQILTNFDGKKRLWIISRDGDYGTVFGGKGFLNRFLYDELCKVASSPDAYLFEDTVEGILHFVETTGVKAEERLTPEEVEEIEKEEESLPHLPQSSEESRRTIADMAKFTQASEDIRRAIAETAKFTQPSEEIRRTIAEIAKFTQPGEEIRRTIAEIAKFTQPGEEIRRTIAEIAKFTQPGEEIRRKIAEIAKFTQPGEEIRRTIAGISEFTKRTEENEKTDESQPAPPPSNPNGNKENKPNEEE
ncbi:MAG: DUF4935 domain-containing protein [Pirellulaceae bacterium]|nr:DUF4935 domain-containing protein [Pirellulaceae bacterium]